MNTTTEQGITFLQAWNYGGPLMWVLAGLSVIAVTLMLYLLISLLMPKIMLSRNSVREILKTK